MADTLPDTIEVRFKPAGDRELLIAIKNLDRATKGLISAQRGLGKAANKSKKDADRFAASLFGITNKGRLLSNTFATLRSKILIASFALVTFIKPISRLIKTAGNANEVLNKFNVVFGEHAANMQNWARETAEALGFAESTLQEFASTFQDTFVPLGFSRGEAAKLSKTLTELAIDVASFSNRLDADVIRDFQSAMVGNHETVRKYGIIIQEANIKQQAYKMGLVEAGEELTNANKVAARFQLIIEGSKDALGDKSRTLGDYNNQIREFNQRLKKTGEELGRSLIPLASTILKIASHFADTDLIRSYTTSIGVLGTTYLIASGSVRKFIIALKASRVALVGSGIGIAIIAIGELWSWYKKLTDEVNSTTEAFDEQKLTVDNIVLTYKQMMMLQLGMTTRLKELRQVLTDPEIMKNMQVFVKEAEPFILQFGQTIDQTANSFEFLDGEQKRLAGGVHTFSKNMATAALNAQSMKDAFISALKAMAAEMMAQAAIFGLLNIFTGGTFGGTTSFVSFLRGGGFTGHGGGAVTTSGIQRFHSGGLAQGEVPAVLQTGEFVLSRQAVQSIGLESARAINEGGSIGGVTININGGIVDEDYLTNTFMPAFNKAKALA